MTPPAPIDPRELRVSDAEREHVVSLLQKATGRGLIDLEEFTGRADTALASRTRAELNAVLVDLPGVVNREVAAAEPVEFRNTMSSTKREGRWVVPKKVLVRNRMGATVLDFTEAVVDHPRVDVEIDVAGGSVELLFPGNASVVADDIEVTAGAVKDKTRGGPRSAEPCFVVRGSVTAGSLALRRPSYVRLGPVTIRRPWKVRWDG